MNMHNAKVFENYYGSLHKNLTENLNMGMIFYLILTVMCSAAKEIQYKLTFFYNATFKR